MGRINDLFIKGELYFSHAFELNDPYVCNTDVQQNCTASDIEYWFERIGKNDNSYNQLEKNVINNPSDFVGVCADIMSFIGYSPFAPQ